jgi:hypothetical protein
MPRDPKARKLQQLPPRLEPLAPGNTRLTDEDPVITRAIKSTPYEKREANRQRERNRENLDLPKPLSHFFDSIMSTFSNPNTGVDAFSRSKMVACLIIEGIRAVVAREGSLKAYFEKRLRTSNAPRFEWDLEVPEVPDEGCIK